MQVINLLDVLKDSIKTEESMPGMQTEEGHNHGYAHFEDSDVQDRTLSDWDGDWQSVYPYLQDGCLDEVMEKKDRKTEKKQQKNIKSIMRMDTRQMFLRLPLMLKIIPCAS